VYECEVVSRKWGRVLIFRQNEGRFSEGLSTKWGIEVNRSS